MPFGITFKLEWLSYKLHNSVTSAEEMVKTFKIDKQQNTVHKQGGSKDYQRVFER